ncbi:MAG TPA: tetratricopeptide repeat protein, partial [Pseudomonadales bacterium]|nr:tetratricopeptide repeat protein [Pseudomonadales bacterium]
DAQLLNEVMLLSQSGRPDLALKKFPANKPLNAELSIARAAILLSVGNVDEAETELTNQPSTEKAPAASAMLAVSHASRNDAQGALAYAQKATSAGPNLALSYIAQSYAQQANLELEAARSSARHATELEPQNAIAWQRLAELDLIHGDLSAAAHASDRALHITPENPDALTQAGFVALFQLKLNKAENLLRQSLKQGSNNPQTRLGLGLTLLRGGHLKAGREQLEYAASLDPTRSVIRSYLGRAYFAEKRDDKAATQWQLAKQFDANDPTPYFYQGVEKLFANDPLGAINEIEQAQALNENRNVYRSETLLQSDAATKSAALARAYAETGNDQAVLIKGTDALRQDPTNAEGHRLLADRYATLPRHDAARVSELLQAQLWGPLSAYPLQPQLTETNLAIAEGLGPERPGLNEYHSLFTQNGGYALLNGFGGSDNSWGDDAVASLLEGP